MLGTRPGSTNPPTVGSGVGLDMLPVKCKESCEVWVTVSTDGWGWESK